MYKIQKRSGFTQQDDVSKKIVSDKSIGFKKIYLLV